MSGRDKLTFPVRPNPDPVKQGYMTADRPQCGNCAACDTEKAVPFCGYGGFDVAAQGWCPMWIALPAWIDRNAYTAAKLGLYAGSVVWTQELPT